MQFKVCFPKMSISEQGSDQMICRFCRQSDIVDNSGTTICPSCKTVFEIDDRVECVFVNTDSLWMPMRG